VVNDRLLNPRCSIGAAVGYAWRRANQRLRFRKKMDVPNTPLTLTKTEGATRQTDAAIDAFFRGNFDIAITLAGAAEGMIERDGVHLWAYFADLDRVRERFSILGAEQPQPLEKKPWISALNSERDWLKHPSGAEPLVIERAAAAIMISRAASKLENWTPRMKEFKAWIVKNLDDL
jgi:hypothetical protein